MTIKDTSEQDVAIKSATSKKKSSLIIIATTVVISALIWQIAPAAKKWSQAERSVSQQRLRIATVTLADFTRDISVQGKVIAAISPTVYAPADGTVTLLSDAGHEVKKGQVIATIDSPELTSRLQQQKVILESLASNASRQNIQSKKQQLIDQKAVDLANVKLTTAKREKRRADQGYNKSAISQIDFEKAQDDLKHAELQFSHVVQDAQLNKESLAFERKSLASDLQRQSLHVEELQRQVNGLNIISPVDGIVGNLNVENKTFLSKNSPILTVVDLSQYEVEINIPESYADDIAIGMEVNIQFEQSSYRARLVTISPEILNNQVTGRVRFTENTPKKLRQNQRVTTQIILEHKDSALQVQRGQFIESSSGKFAYKITNGMAQKTPIILGARSLSSVEVLDGLEEGDQIIISSTDMFNDASQIQLN